MKKIIYSILALVLSGVPALASAATGLGEGKSRLDTVVGRSGLSGSLDITIGNVIKGVLALSGTIFLVLMVYGGILWMTAAGNESTVEKAQSIIKSAVIGLAIALSAYAITAFVTGKLA